MCSLRLYGSYRVKKYAVSSSNRIGTWEHEESLLLLSYLQSSATSYKLP